MQPWAAAPRLQLALIQEPSNVAAANRSINEAIERANEDWRIWLVATRLRAKAGDKEGAREALNRTRALVPPSPALTRVLNAIGKR
jgi:Flp pilus assembly protein TadD